MPVFGPFSGPLSRPGAELPEPWPPRAFLREVVFSWVQGLGDASASLGRFVQASAIGKARYLSAQFSHKSRKDGGQVIAARDGFVHPLVKVKGPAHLHLKRVNAP